MVRYIWDLSVTLGPGHNFTLPYNLFYASNHYDDNFFYGCREDDERWLSWNPTTVLYLMVDIRDSLPQCLHMQSFPHRQIYTLDFNHLVELAGLGIGAPGIAKCQWIHAERCSGAQVTIRRLSLAPNKSKSRTQKTSENVYTPVLLLLIFRRQSRDQSTVHSG